MSGADLALIVGHGGLLFPDGTGEIADLGEFRGVARWYALTTELEREQLRPAKRAAADALYAAMDAEGVYTLRTEDGLEVSGESRAAWQGATTVDTAELFHDVWTVRHQEGFSVPAAMAWAEEFFRLERTLTASGRARLERMSGKYAAALRTHSEPAERSRKAPTVRHTGGTA